MALTEVARGSVSFKTLACASRDAVGVKPWLLTPVMVTDGKGALGLRLDREEGESLLCFWLPEGEAKLLRAWRSMKFVENLCVVEPSTLLKAWRAAAETLTQGEVEDCLDLAKPFGDPYTFRAYRSVMMSKVPGDGALASMLEVVRDCRVALDDLASLEALTFAGGYPRSSEILGQIRQNGTPQTTRPSGAGGRPGREAAALEA